MPVETPITSGIAIAKTSGYLGAIAVFQYLNIPTEQFGILAVLMTIDFVTGVGKQYRIDPKEIKSHLAWLGAMKKIATLMSVLSVALVLRGLQVDDHRYVNAVLAIFIMAEGYSTIQNIYAVRTGKVLPEFDVISLVLKAMGDYFKNKIDSTVKKTLESSESND